MPAGPSEHGGVGGGERSERQPPHGDSRRSGTLIVCSLAAGTALLRSHRLARAAANEASKDSPRAEVLSLYRQIMRAAQNWPSLKRNAVISGIRDEFRNARDEADPQKIMKRIAAARAGLKELLHEVGEGERLRATPSQARGAWPLGTEQPKLAQWALDQLGIGTSPTMAEAKTAYHERAKACHPDSGNATADAEAFKNLNRAWEYVQKQLPRTHHAGRSRA